VETAGYHLRGIAEAVANSDLVGDSAYLCEATAEGVSPEIKNHVVTVLRSKRSEVGSERHTRELGAPQGRA
jgi:hypothetical protein